MTTDIETPGLWTRLRRAWLEGEALPADPRLSADAGLPERVPPVPLSPWIGAHLH